MMKISCHTIRRLAASFFTIIFMFGMIQSNALASCGAEFCTSNTGQEVLGSDDNELTTQIDIRYDTSLQNQPRLGAKAVEVGAVHRDHDEVKTSNQTLTLSGDFAVTPNWGVTFQFPFIIERNHDHIHDPQGEARGEHWALNGVGDMQILGRYHFAIDSEKTRTAGIRFGLKLPTGSFTKINNEGEEAERSLQTGTGTTDLVLGGYYNQRAGNNGKYFVSLFWQNPLNNRNRFRPGDRISLDTGYRHRFTKNLSGILQGNLIIRGRDSGLDAEPENTGSTTIAITPGLSYAISQAIQLYGLIQIPIYQHVNDIQLTSNNRVSIGLILRP